MSHELFLVFGWEIFYARNIQTAMYIFIMWENFGTKLFWHLRWENFLSRFHCISVWKYEVYSGVFNIYIILKFHRMWSTAVQIIQL